MMFDSYLATASTVCSRSWSVWESVLGGLGSSYNEGIGCRAAVMMMMSSMSGF